LSGLEISRLETMLDLSNDDGGDIINE